MIKYVLLTLSLLLFSYSTWAKVSVEKEGVITNYSFSIDSLKITKVKVDGMSFEKVLLNGVQTYSGVFGKLGGPAIPVVRVIVDVKNLKDISVEWDSAKGNLKSLGSTVYPVQPSYSKSAKQAPDFIYNKDQYTTKKTAPNFTTEIVGSFQGAKRVMVTLFPFQYHADNNSYKLTKRFTVKVKEMSVEKSGDEAIVFVVGRAFEKSNGLQKYIQLKRQMGYRVFTHQLTRRNKKPAKIRAAIQKIFKTDGVNLKYVLLIGDDDDVPGQKAKYIMGTTDHYYRAVDTNDYDSDINGPDLGVGRISAKNNKQLDSIFNKLTVYQRGEFSDESWLEQIAFIATDDRYKVAEASHNYAIDTYTKAANYIGNYPNNGELGGDRLYAITEHATAPKTVKHISDGRFIINYSGHGSTKTWAGPRVSQSNVRKMDHSDARPFVISNACITGQFQIKECFAETWLRHPQGAVMMWASMDSTYWDEDDLLEKSMYDAIFKLKLQNFNKITQYALGKVFSHYGALAKGNYYWETYHMFGDPSMRLRDGKTVEVVIYGTLTAQIGSKQHQLRIMSSTGKALPGARVSLMGSDNGKDILIVGYSNDNGEVQLDLSKVRNETTLKLAIYGHNTKLSITGFTLYK